MVKRVHHRSVARHLLAGTLGTVGALAVSTQIASANSVLVKAGDTVWKIAQENKTTVKAVEDANGGAIKKASNSVDLIYAGQRLQLPGNDSTASTMADADASGYYTVAPGDTISKIAEHFNISVSTLKALNGLTSDQLYIGQRLLVDGSQATAVLSTPSVQQQVTTTTSTPTSTVSQPVETAPVTSTTQSAVSSAPVNSATPSSEPSTQMSTAAAVNTTATVNVPSANNVPTSSVATVASQAGSGAVATSTQPSQTSAAVSNSQPQNTAYQSQTVQVSAVASTANSAVAASASQSQTTVATNVTANSQTQSSQASGQAQTSQSTTSQAQSQAPATTNASQTQGTTNSNLQSGSVVSLATKIANSNSVPYVWGGSSLSGMDCSGLVDYVYKNAEGKQLPHNTVALESCVNQHSVSQAQAGDILFWGQHGATYHSAIYIGNNQYVAAAKPGTNVSTYTISSYFMPSFAGTVK